MVFGKGVNDVPNSKRTKLYQTWHSMIRRCYSENYQKTKPSYIGVNVCDDWLLHSKFVEDIKTMVGYENHLNGDWVLDKDILTKDKVYSKETCCFVPPEINGVFGKKRNDVKDLPQGVHFNNRNKVYIASCCNGNGFSEYLGSFGDVESAVRVYNDYKTNRVKQLAEKYKSDIDIRVYNALIEFKVDR